MTQPTVCIVDDEELNLQLLAAMLAGQGYELRTFDSANAFLAALPLPTPCCLLLDNLMPELNGIDLFLQFQPELVDIPVIFMSGLSPYEDVFSASRHGAFAFLQKPLQREQLLLLVKQALKESATRAANRGQVSEDQARYDSLTLREKEIFRLMAEGAPNKQTARTLGITVRTVEFHRANILKKLEKTLLSDLIAMGKQIEL